MTTLETCGWALAVLLVGRLLVAAFVQAVEWAINRWGGP